MKETAKHINQNIAANERRSPVGLSDSLAYPRTKGCVITTDANGQRDEDKRIIVAPKAEDVGSGTGLAKSMITSFAMYINGAQQHANPQATSVSWTLLVRPKMKTKILKKAAHAAMHDSIAGLYLREPSTLSRRLDLVMTMPSILAGAKPHKCKPACKGVKPIGASERTNGRKMKKEKPTASEMHRAKSTLTSCEFLKVPCKEAKRV